MKKTAEVIIVGAGVIGASIAFHLTRLGLRDVLLLDKGRVAGAASGRSGALVRTHYTSIHEARLALAALPWFQNWAEWVGGDAGFVQTGFVQLVGPQDHALLRRNVAALQAIGVDTRLLDPSELAELQPQFRVDDGSLAAYEPQSGYADPIATTCSLVEVARRAGAAVYEGVAVTALRTTGDRVVGIETSAGPVDAPVVVLANGAWTNALTEPLGLRLPIHPVRIEIGFFARPAAFPRGPAGHLTIIDRATGIYGRPHGDDLSLIGLSKYRYPLPDYDDYLDHHDPAFVEQTRKQAALRIPSLADAPYVRGHCGPLDITSDGRPIIDRAPGYNGLFLATGMSGGGFKKAPAIGACVAELIVDGAAKTAPITPFRVTRFAENAPIVVDEYTVPHEATSLDRATALHGKGLIH